MVFNLTFQFRFKMTEIQKVPGVRFYLELGMNKGKFTIEV